MTTTEPLLQVAGLGAGYGGRVVIEDINLQVKPGETRFILGPNGAGKTTLVRALTGSIRMRGGTKHWEGSKVNRRSPRWLARNGLLQTPQGDDVFPRLSVRDNLSVQLAALGKPNGVRSLDEIMDRFPLLRARVDQLAGTLSGGERRLLAIARSVLANPRLLLCDEPTIGLSPLAIGQVCEQLRMLGASGVAVVVVEQHIPCVESVGGIGGLMIRGRYRDIGAATEIRSNHDVRRALLGESDTPD